MADSNITRNAMAAAMKALMKEKKLSKISISDICGACGMNRNSFYYHFKDKYDLINWIFYTEFVSNIHLEEYKDALQLLEDICDYLYQERDFYRVALKMEGQNSFQEYFSEVMDPYLKYLADQIMGAGKEEAFFLRFFGDAFLMAIIRWIMDENIMQPENLSDSWMRQFPWGRKRFWKLNRRNQPIHPFCDMNRERIT